MEACAGPRREAERATARPVPRTHAPAGTAGSQTRRPYAGGLITGGSGGIGRAVAQRLAQDGFGVVVNYAGNPAKADQTVADIKGRGGRGIALQADVAKPEDVDRLFDNAATALGTVDVVVHCAGIMPLGPIGDNEVQIFDRVIATNLRGTFLVLARAAQRVTTGGRIIAFSSSVLAKSFPCRLSLCVMPLRAPVAKELGRRT